MLFNQTMKTLLIMRHAKSSWSHDLPDYDRPLNGRGKTDAPRMGQHLKSQGLTPDIILSSSAKRARKTAKAVQLESGCEEAVVLLEDLYLADPDAYITALNDVADAVDIAMVVGHNPGIAELLHVFTEEFDPYPTATVAEVQFQIESWAALTEDTPGILKNIWKPRFL